MLPALSPEKRQSSKTMFHLHEVILGGTGKERGDRHPKIKSGVLLEQAQNLSNVTIGECAKIELKRSRKRCPPTQKRCWCPSGYRRAH